MELTPKDIMNEAVLALDSKKGQDIRVIKVEDISVLCDYFVICTGTSTTQIKSLSDEVEVRLLSKGVSALRNEGYSSGSWIVMDYASVIVHLFSGDMREFYKLEKLWADGQDIDISALTGAN